ncbi:TonB-dependent receptor [Stakelama tenebrarum]|uniref:TonB-dependent receptor n=1 Tax=Stakelama tenebrarum TaxID=2711215 RepID=UPI001D17DDA0|nr:TonB-dependent receptor [Sphingosinithalassobacter tenebrarum]
MLAGSALFLAIAAQPASAQQSEAEPIEGEEITVFAPILDAQEAALEQQRNADNLVNIIASDTVGRFPDQNSAAALARLPAVAVQRDQGQERYIQVRGAPNRWTSVSFDGVPVIGVDEGGNTRAFRFDAVPAVILDSIAVNKSLTPDLPAEAVVAQIDLRTYSPFEQSGLAVQADLGYGWMELGGGEQRQGSARLSWSNDSIGFVIGGSHYRRHQTTDNREFGYTGDLLDSYDVRSYKLVRENNGATAGVEWHPDTQSRVFANFVYSDFSDDEERNMYTFQLANALGGTRTPTGGDLIGVPVRSTAEYGEYRTRNYIATIGGDVEGDDWRAKLRLNYTRTENTTYLPLILENQQFNPLLRPSMTYDLSDPNFPIAQLYTTVPGATPGSYARGTALTALDQSAFDFVIGLPIVSDTFSDSYVAKADFVREFEAVTVKAGVQYDDRAISGNTIAQSNAVLLTAYLPAVGMTINPADYVTGEAWESNFPRGFDLTYLDNKGFRTDFENGLVALEAAGLYDPADNVPAVNLYDIEEQLLAGYAMAKWEFGTGQVVAGARVEHYARTSHGFIVDDSGVPAPLSVDFTATDIFPSVNAKFDLTQDLVFRISGQRGTARPSFGQIRTGASISDVTTPGTVSGGNPLLRPEYTWGTDASLEYYLSGAGVISISGFYRWVDNVLYDSQDVITDDTYDSPGIDRTGYRFVSSFNGSNGKLYGVELSYLQQWDFLPGALSGFGFQGNIALLDGSFDTPSRQDVPFPGTSKTVVNASLFYEKYGISARVSYQWRDDWPDTLGGLGLGSGGDEYRKGYGNLDVALRYALTPNFTLFADLNNLTDETYVAYEGSVDRPSEVEQIGRRFLFGVRVNY